MAFLTGEEIRQGIRRCRAYELEIFGCRPENWRPGVLYYRNPQRPDKLNNNFFYTEESFEAETIVEALALRRAEGFGDILLRSSRRMNPVLMASFGLYEEKLVTMALPGPLADGRPDPPGLQIKDIQTDDIRSDLLDVSDVPPSLRGLARRNMARVLEVAASHPEYHWYIAYLNGERAGNIYALHHDGFTESDDLFVVPDKRGQGVGTALLRHARNASRGVLYLHVSAYSRAGRLYERLGFRRAEVFYEYTKHWDLPGGSAGARRVN